DKESPVRARKIDRTHIVGLDDVPAKIEVVRRQPELHGENVYGADRKQTQRGVASSDAVDHLVDRSVATGRDDLYKAFLDCIAGEGFRLRRVRRDAYGAIADD